MTVWVDVTTLLSWTRPPVGIVRTELECARHAVEADDPARYSLCYYSKEAGEFMALLPAQREKIDRLLSGEYTDSSTSAKLKNVVKDIEILEPNAGGRLTRILDFSDRYEYSIDLVEDNCIRGWIFNRKYPLRRVVIELRAGQQVIFRTVCDTFRKDLEDAKISDGSCAFRIPIMDILENLHLAGATIVDIRVSGMRRHDIGRITIDAAMVEECLAGAQALVDERPITLGRDDVYVTAGLDWNFKDFNKIYELKKRHDFKVVGFCYDLISIKYPHLCVDDVAAFYSKYLVDLIWCADHIVCISKCSQNDLLEFLSESGCRPVETSVVRLGSSLKTAPAAAVIRPEIKDVCRSKFILFVSTIERRKNHEVLYRAYTRLIDKGVSPLPQLVFVGMPGWGVDEFLKDISLDPRITGLIRLLDHVSDDELALLYSCAMFTVFPSLYEGWGLPVAEALAYGTYCLSSDRGSLPEIAGDLLDYLDPWDAQEWADRMEELITSPRALAKRVKAVRERFRPDAWTDCAQQVFRTAERCLEPPPAMAALKRARAPRNPKTARRRG
jgi:glycosyltransferase involved in cell wall biosynthesis